MLRELEDEKVTDEIVEDVFTEEAVDDGFTDVDVAFDEVLLIFEEDEVEVGFCCFVRTRSFHDSIEIAYL